jgi:uncharacterized membrane protein YagU involved in acid resistance
MTLAMFAMQRSLPRRQQRRLEPGRITDDMLRRVGLRENLRKNERDCAATIAHFGYGAAVGAAYPLVSRLPLPSGTRGPAYGLLVCAASYAGWLPAIETLPPPQRRPAGRNVLLIAAHLVWGMATEALSERVAPRA